MVSQLLPASAKAFEPRSGPNVVLGSRAEGWLTTTLKRVNKLKRPLNNVSQHKKCLEYILSGKDAIWSLASIVLPKSPASELRKDDDPLVEAFANYQMLHIDGYVVHVDMVLQYEVAFKLTQDTIDCLAEYHRDIYSVDAAAEYTYDWPEKSRQVQKLQDDFVQSINSYVFRTGHHALEGLEDEGTGELLECRSMDVKQAINDLFKPLLPPPPKIIDVIGPPMGMGWWQSQYVIAGGYQYQAQYSQPYVPQYAPPPPQYHQQQYLQRPMEPWRVLGSTPSPSPSHHSEIQSTPWSQLPQQNYNEITHLPSPTPSYTQPYSQASQYQPQPAFSSPTPLPLPSQLISQQCSTAAASTYASSFYGYNDSPLTPQWPQYAF